MISARRVFTLTFLLVAALAAQTAYAWWPEGHSLIAEAAVRALPEDMPKWFRESGNTLASYSVDADLWKERSVPRLRQQEGPEHYLDLELLKGKPLPPTRKEFFDLCRELEIDPYKVGTLPYAVEEWHDRLVIAFAEHRRWPEDERIRAKILVLAGIMSHYTGDASQPLHCTVHYNGRVGPDGESPRSGIHYKMDALPANVGIRIEELVSDQDVLAVQSVFDLSRAVIKKSHGMVDRVYKLETKLPPPRPAEGYHRTGDPEAKTTDGKADKKQKAVDADVRALCLEACREGTRFTAIVWYTAWKKSADVKLPSWHKQYKQPQTTAAAAQ